MRALITNDDGIDSPGVRILAQVAVAAGLEVTVAAPDGERSGTSAMMSGLESGGRLLAEERKLDGLEGVPTLAVRATPAMIAFVAVAESLTRRGLNPLTAWLLGRSDGRSLATPGPGPLPVVPSVYMT